MDVLLLPGNDSLNKEWIEEVAEKTTDLFGNHAIQNYDHWENEDRRFIDFDLELDRLADTTKDIDDYAVFAKSAGVALALLGIDQNKIAPKYCIFVGSPLSFAERFGIDVKKFLDDLKVPVLFIQQVDDPAASFDSLQAFVKDSGLGDYEMIKIPGDDHAYSDVDELAKLVKEFAIVYK